MPVSVTMPRLGESVTEGTVTRWLKSEGDQVEADEPLLEVSTDKVDTEVPSPASGILLSIKVQEDETVEIGVELAVIGDEGDEPPRREARRPPHPAEPRARAGRQHRPSRPEPEPGSRPPHCEPPARAASRSAHRPPGPRRAAGPAPPAPAPAPPARRRPGARRGSQRRRGRRRCRRHLRHPAGAQAGQRARRRPQCVTGTGVGGRIRKSDVLAAAEQAAAAAWPAARPSPGPPRRSRCRRRSRRSAAAAAATGAPSQRGRVEKLSRMRQVIAARMVESLQTSAQLTTVVEVDVTKIARLRAQAKQDFEAARGRQADVPAVLRGGGGRGAQGAPDRELVGEHRGEDRHLPRRRAPGHRGRHRARPAGPGHPRRRRPQPGRPRPQDRRPRRPHPREQGQPGRAGRRHVHADQHRQPRRAVRHPDHQPATGRHPRHRRRRQACRSWSTTPNLGETIAIRSMVYLALSYDHRIVDGADAARFLGTMKERLEAGNFERALGLA